MRFRVARTEVLSGSLAQAVLRGLDVVVMLEPSMREDHARVRVVEPLTLADTPLPFLTMGHLEPLDDEARALAASYALQQGLGEFGSDNDSDGDDW